MGLILYHDFLTFNISKLKVMYRNQVILVFLILIALACSRDKEGDQLIPVETVKYVNIGTDRIAYKVYGEGFPILMCMGYSGTMDLWQPEVIDKLSEHFKVITFDYPGMGYSTTHNTSFTIRELADCAFDFIRAINIDKAHLLGWSMGTNVVLEFVLNYSDYSDNVILYAGDCGDTIAIFPPEWVVEIMTAKDTTPEALLSILFPPEWLAAHPDPEEYFPDIEETANPEVVAMQWEALEKWNSQGGGVVGRLGSINKQLLLITGNQDVCTPTANSYILLDSVTNSSLVLLQDCGHGAMYQMPHKFSDYILTFLKKK